MTDEFKINIRAAASPGVLRLIGPAPTPAEPGLEMMRFEANGDIYVRNIMTTNDPEVVEGFRAFLVACGTIKPSDERGEKQGVTR